VLAWLLLPEKLPTKLSWLPRLQAGRAREAAAWSSMRRAGLQGGAEQGSAGQGQAGGHLNSQGAVQIAAMRFPATATAPSPAEQTREPHLEGAGGEGEMSATGKGLGQTTTDCAPGAAWRCQPAMFFRVQERSSTEKAAQPACAAQAVRHSSKASPLETATCSRSPPVKEMPCSIEPQPAVSSGWGGRGKKGQKRKKLRSEGSCWHWHWRLPRQAGKWRAASRQ
jgi:hypothetical protein